MHLAKLSDQILLSKTESLVQSERELLSEILHHLREIERRRLFSQLGFKSLFDYATKKLKYSDDQAARRISAMRLLRELPGIESKIADGSLTLTNLGMAQTLFRQESKSRDEKLEILSKLEHKSKREAERLILSHSSEPESLGKERIRAVTETHVEIKFIASSELQEKLEKVKGLLAHSNPNMTMSEAIHRLCDMAIQKLDPAKRGRKSVAPPAPALKLRVTAAARREVWQQAGGRCQNCSVHALQVDHIQPKALGGSNARENLRLLCRPCNQRAAINKLGLAKMQRYSDCITR